MSNAIHIGTYHKVRLYTPFTYFQKRTIVDLAAELRVPVQLTRSCYEDKVIACGKCPTCVERIQAFRSEGWIDPVQYQIDLDWFGCTIWQYKGIQND